MINVMTTTALFLPQQVGISWLGHNYRIKSQPVPIYSRSVQPTTRRHMLHYDVCFMITATVGATLYVRWLLSAVPAYAMSGFMGVGRNDGLSPLIKSLNKMGSI